MSDSTPVLHHRRRPQRRHWYRLALAVTIALVVLVIVLLPLAVRSMQEVLGRGREPLFDFATGAVVSHDAAAAAGADATYFNFGLVDLDEQTGQVTIAVSGNRECGGACPKLDLIFAALDDDADQRRGLPPSASLTLAPDDRVFSHAVQLPVRGQPSLYPFDQYQLWLGVGGVATLPDGSTMELTPDTVAQNAVITLQNRIPDMIMPSPMAIDPELVRSDSDPYGFVAVKGITIERPVYLEVLAVVLVLLIAVSALLALLTRGLDELVIGFGGLILGVWGVRSILMPQALPTVTAIDLALSWLIMLLLLGLAIRAALHFLRQSELPAPRRTRREAGGGRREAGDS